MAQAAGVNDTSQNDKKKKAGAQPKKKKGAESREGVLATLAPLNRRVFKDCIEFDLTKLINLVNDMLRTRYAYVFNNERTPDQMISIADAD